MKWKLWTGTLLNFLLLGPGYLLFTRKKIFGALLTTSAFIATYLEQVVLKALPDQTPFQIMFVSFFLLALACAIDGYQEIKACAGDCEAPVRPHAANALIVLLIAAFVQLQALPKALAGGPIDGVWVVDQLTCDGIPQPIPGTFTLQVDGDAGVFVQAFTDSCVIRTEERYVYPAEGIFGIIPENTRCKKNSDCSFLGGCLPLPPPTEFNYSIGNRTLTFDRVATSPADYPCVPGQNVRFLMYRR